MEKHIRLVFRMVVLELEIEDIHKLIGQIKKMMSPIGIFFDYNIEPYPKVSGSNMVLIDFDVPLPFENGLEEIVGLLGGTGWHFSKVSAGHEQDAIWAESDMLQRPLGEYLIWAQVQLISLKSLPKSRKHAHG